MGGDAVGNADAKAKGKMTEGMQNSNAPITLLEAAALDIPEANGQVYPEAEAAMALEPDLALGIDCCAVCGKPEEDISDPVECNDCKSILYCCEEHCEIDSETHESVCGVLKLTGDLDEVEIEEEALAKSIRVAVAIVGKIAALGEEECKRRLGEFPDLPGPGENGEPPPGLGSEKWAGILGHSAVRKCLSADSAGGKASASKNKSGGSKEALSALQKRLGTALSYPLTVVAALQRFPELLQALRAPKGGPGSSSGSSRSGMAHIHVLGASDAECEHIAAWKSVQAGCQLENLCITFVGPEVPEERHCGEEDLGQGGRAVFWRGSYQDFIKDNTAAARKAALVVGFNMGLSCPDYDWAATLELLSRSRSPLLTLTNTLPELSMEQEVFEEAGITCSEALPNIFPCPCPVQSGTVANDVYRKNAWLTLYHADLPPATQPHASLASRQLLEKRPAASGSSAPGGKPKKKKKNH